ncbi:MAG TPA: helix-hairpin-helix domain-containing protein [Methyloversatilis sp.]
MRHLICAVLLCLSSASALAVIDLNSASASELDGLPGIGPGRAQAIVDYRQAHGPFTSVDDLGKVKGIGDKTLAEVRPLVIVGQRAGAAAEAGPSIAAPDVAVPLPHAAPAPSAFPWGWLAFGALVAAVIAFLALRRRPTHAPAPSTEAAPEVKPATASPVPRPAGSEAHVSVAPARSAGAPPRPAGSAPAPAVHDTDSTPTPAAPKPVGAPPRPAGSR